MAIWRRFTAVHTVAEIQLLLNRMPLMTTNPAFKKSLTAAWDIWTFLLLVTSLFLLLLMLMMLALVKRRLQQQQRSRLELDTRSKMNSFQVIAWPAATTCPHHVRKPGRKWVREQSAHLSPFHKGGARHHREQDPGEEVGRQEKGGEEGSQHRGKKSLATVDTMIVKKHPLDPR